jgi:SAM-dependent methyltransferase
MSSHDLYTQEGWNMQKDECLVCCELNYKLLHSTVRNSTGSQIRKCNHCDFVYLFPRPSESDLASYYQVDYRDHYQDEKVENRFNIDLPEAYARVARLESFLNRTTKVLEIGSGSGAFLAAVAPFVSEIVGIEPDKAAREWLQEKQGKPVFKSVDELMDQEKQFDIIVLFHVLEHFVNPITFLAKIKSLLSQNGRIIIEVPNVEDALVSAYNIEAFKDFYYCSAHLSYFSATSLQNCFYKAGYTAVVEFVQRYDLSNHFTWLQKGIPGGMAAFKYITPLTNLAYETDLIRKGISDTLWAVAVPN